MDEQRVDDVTQEELSRRLADNVRALREARGLSQDQMAKMSGLPRATWTNIESGGGNPTLAVLHRVASVFSVPFEELLAPASSAARHFPRESLSTRERGGVLVRSLLPHKVPNLVLERMELPRGSRMAGTPHTTGTREYLACEKGSIELTASGERFTLSEGDVVVFRGDQRHGYANVGTGVAVGYSVVVLRPVP